MRFGLLCRSLLVAVVVLLSGLPLSAGQPDIVQRRKLSSTELARLATPSVVTILTKASQGSGVIVDAAGVVVTNLHVIRGQAQVSVRLANGDIYDDVSVVDVDERKDLVLLKIKAFGLPAAPLGNSEQVATGDHVVLIGSPRGRDLTVSDGLISAVRDSGEGYKLFQTSAAASPGSSGGGMFNEYGELVGIVSLKLTTGENINFAVPVNYLRGLMSTQVTMTLTQLAARFPAGAAAPAAGQPSSTPQPPSPAFLKLQSLLASSRYKPEKATETSWLVRFTGNHAQSLPVYISEYRGFVLVQGIAAKNVNLSPSQMEQLLKANLNTDLTRISVSNDKALVVLGEADLRVLDAAGLEQLVDEVASNVDNAFDFIDKGGGAVMGNRPALTGPPSGRLRSYSVLQGHISLDIDSSHWKMQETAEAGVSQFVHDSNAAYVRLIAERVEIPLEKMAEIALDNVRKVDPKVRETQRGWRTVNGKRMLYLEFEATVDNLPISYYGHYYSDSSGTVQIIGWTHRTVIDAYRDDIERFVSGFQIKK